MAERKITLRRHNGGVAGTLADYDDLLPTTTTDQILSAADGTTQVFDTNHKLKAAYLPDFVFGGMRFAGAITGTGNASGLYTTALSHVTTNGGSVDGIYFISVGTYTITGGTDSTNNVTHNFAYGPVQGPAGEESDVNFTDGLTIENGDWLVIIRRWDYLGVTNVQWGVVNNTYADATTTVKGIVTLSSNTGSGSSVATTGTAVVTNDVISSLGGTTSTKFAFGNHLHTGVYQGSDVALDNLVSTMDGATTGFIKKSGADTYSLDTNSYLDASNTSVQDAFFGDIHLRDDSTPSHYLKITATSNLTAGRTLSIATGDADRTLTFGGNITTSAGALTINAQAAGSTLSLPSTLTVGAVTANGILYGSSTNVVGMIASTTIGRNTLIIPDITAISFPRYNADETISMLDAATFRTAIGAGTSSTSGTVTSIATSGAITGGTITTTGTISHSTADGNLHLPATGTTNNKKFLVAGSTAGSSAWETWPRVYYDTLPTTAQEGDIYLDID